jgi:hypothetical protein
MLGSSAPRHLGPTSPTAADLAVLVLAAYGFDRAIDHAFWRAQVEQCCGAARINPLPTPTIAEWMEVYCDPRAEVPMSVITADHGWFYGFLRWNKEGAKGAPSATSAPLKEMIRGGFIFSQQPAEFLEPYI